VLRGELPGPYIDENAHGYAVAALIPRRADVGRDLESENYAIRTRGTLPHAVIFGVSGDTGLSVVCDRSWQGLRQRLSAIWRLEQRDRVEAVEDAAAVEVGLVEAFV
jgi:hypothetical protein